MNKKALAALGGLAAFGILTASAASLGGLTSSSLGADQTVIASCDTDLAPAAEALLQLRRINGTPLVRAIAWARRQNKIRVAGSSFTHHRIDERDYLAMQDLTDYAA